MNALERIMNTPVWRLSPAEIAMLPDEDQSRAFGALLDMARAGDLGHDLGQPARYYL